MKHYKEKAKNNEKEVKALRKIISEHGGPEEAI
jgi:hypothetical protein